MKTSPYYPQSNVKLERWHESLKHEAIRPNCPRNADEAARAIRAYVRHYHEVRFHGAIGYFTPADNFAGLTKEIHAERDRKFEDARVRRRAGSQENEFAKAS